MDRPQRREQAALLLGDDRGAGPRRQEALQGRARHEGRRRQDLLLGSAATARSGRPSSRATAIRNPQSALSPAGASPDGSEAGARPLRAPTRRDELPPRLSRRKLRRCRQACGAGARHRAAEGARRSPSASSIRMPASGSTISPRRSPPRPPNGRAASAGCSGATSPLAALPAPLAAVLAPYLAAVKAVNPEGRLALVSGLADAGADAAPAAGPADGGRTPPRGCAPARRAASPATSRSGRSSSTAGWRSARFVPPKERRGLVLVDPPYEEQNEFRHAGRRLPEGA